MNGLIGENKIAEALELCHMLTWKRCNMGHKGILNATILNAIFKTGDVAKAIRVLNKMDYVLEHFIDDTITDGLCKCGRVDSAMSHFTVNMSIPDVADSFNNLIQGFANLGRWYDVRRVLRKMVLKKVNPDSYTFCVLMDALGGSKSAAHDISETLTSLLTVPCLNIVSFFPEGSVMVDQQYKKGYPVKSILEIMSDVKADLVAYNSLMKRYCLDRHMEKAIQVFNSLGNSGLFRPNISSYNILINGYCSRMELDEALQLYREIPQEGLRPNMETYNSLLKGLLIAGRCVDAQLIFQEMINRGIKTDMSTYSTLLNSLSNRGSAEGTCEDAGQLWYKWLKPDLCHEKLVNQAEKLLLGVLDENPDEDILIAKIFRNMRRK